jgi:hypothetical protein
MVIIIFINFKTDKNLDIDDISKIEDKGQIKKIYNKD